MDFQELLFDLTVLFLVLSFLGILSIAGDLIIFVLELLRRRKERKRPHGLVPPWEVEKRFRKRD